MGVTLKILWTQTLKMYKLLIASVLAAATALPIEDTADVAAAKAEFNAAFAAAEAGEHAALAPVNSDTQAAQIATSYIADTEDVAAAKAAFQAAFDDAAAGGLAAKQAPAPVHEIAAASPLATGYNLAAYPYAAAGVVGYPYAAGLGLGYPYAAGLPVLAAAAAPAAAE